jgi:hypothetical protein
VMSDPPSAMVSVAEVAGAVMATLFTLVAVATPKVGVTNVGLVAKTRLPVPVSSEITPRSWLLVVAPNTASVFVVVGIVPAVGNVRLVTPVVVKVRAWPPACVSVELAACVSSIPIAVLAAAAVSASMNASMTAEVVRLAIILRG